MNVSRIALALALTGFALQTACESCEFSYGSIDVEGTLTVEGPVPPDLEIRLCTSAHADTCDPATYQLATPSSNSTFLGGPGDVAFTYQGGIPSEGTSSCSFARHWLVITGTGCEETAIDVPVHDTPPEIDATLHCR